MLCLQSADEETDHDRFTARAYLATRVLSCHATCQLEPCVDLRRRLTKEKAKEKYGITMHARKNGDAGIRVWLEFKKEGWLEKLTYAELRVENSKGRRLISAGLEPKPGARGQSKDTSSLRFRRLRNNLRQCSFFLVCYGSNEGDVGYYLKAKDFLDLTNPITDK